MRRPAKPYSTVSVLPSAAKANAGPNAARSQDFLYGEDGLPR